MKKLTTILTATAIAATLAIGTAAFAACGGGGKAKDKLSADTPQEAYGFSAATAGMVISGMDGGEKKASAISRGMNAQVTDEQTIAELNGYMALVEGLLADGGFEITDGANGDEAYAQYANAMTVSCPSLDGEKISYTTYYNSELKGSFTDRDDDEPWEDEEITEVYAVEGVMLIDGAAYPLEGRFVNETEGTENENTHYLKVQLGGEGDYLTVTQENENEDDETETEYVYTVYSGGRVAERTTFEFESERGETEIAMSIDDRANGRQSYFELEKETERGRETIKIEADGREYVVRTETDENGGTQYVYYSEGNRVGRGDRHDRDD